MIAKSKTIDWVQVKRRLEESRTALERALTLDPARLEEVYRRRAVELANRRFAATSQAATLQVLVFFLGEERYGLELNVLAEVFPCAKCTPVPTGPPELVGVINVRGEIRSVVDLGRLLKLPQTDALEAGYILLLRMEGWSVGLRVDRVEAVERISPEGLTLPGEGGDLPSVRFLRGVTPGGLIVLNAGEISSHPIFGSEST